MGKRYILIMAFYENGNLYQKWKNGNRSDSQIQKWMQQAVYVVDLLAEQGVAHGDIRMENFLLDATDNLVLCDFGQAYGLYLKKQWTLSTEIYNLGIILCRFLYDVDSSDAPKNVVDLCRRMLLPPKDRIRIADIKRHPYIVQ